MGLSLNSRNDWLLLGRLTAQKSLSQTKLQKATCEVAKPPSKSSLGMTGGLHRREHSVYKSLQAEAGLTWWLPGTALKFQIVPDNTAIGKMD